MTRQARWLLPAVAVALGACATTPPCDPPPPILLPVPCAPTLPPAPPPCTPLDASRAEHLRCALTDRALQRAYADTLAATLAACIAAP